MFSKVKQDIVNKILSKNRTKEPKAKQVFAIVTGTYVGEMLVYCKKDKSNYYFLSIPKNINRVIPVDKFNFALDNKIAEYVKDLPKNIYVLCCKQFEYNESAIDTKAKQIK